MFVKRSDGPTTSFKEEAFGLGELSARNKIRCVKVIAFDQRSITLEKIETEPPTKEFWRTLGSQLADLHDVRLDYYGFEIDNHIGATPQPNPKIPVSEISWADYFLKHRLEYMLGHSRLKSETELHRLYAKAKDAIHRSLSTVNEAPSLVHGDLWRGNVLCAKGQIPVLIDPAPYSGHREVDVAMTELFGGFDPEFYASYNERLPLAAGFDARKQIYNLYHLLNHWILFGETYAGQTLNQFRHLNLTS